MQAEAAIRDCSIDKIVKQFGDNIPTLKKIRTDAKISLTAMCDGFYNAVFTKEQGR